MTTRRQRRKNQHMKQRLVRAGKFWLPLVCVLVLSAPGSVRSFLYRCLYPLVPVDDRQLSAPPDRLRALGYVQDNPADLGAFTAFAQSAVRPATTDGQRLRFLSDALYNLRQPNTPWIEGGRAQGVVLLFEKMQQGAPGLCGHNTLVLAALWHSLGRDFRTVRFTTNDQSAWFAAHYGIEVFSPDTSQWTYYDFSLNGYAVDDAGAPLSLAGLNEELAAGRDVAIVANPTRHDWDLATFMTSLREHQLQVYSLNNHLRNLDADRRFGRLHFAHDMLARLPRPFDGVMDAVTGDGGPRLVLSAQPPPPAAHAKLHLTGSPVG